MLLLKSEYISPPLQPAHRRYPKVDPKLKVLFICSKNQWRSPTAEKIYRNHPNIIVRSAGTSPQARRTVSSKDLEWADLVLLMEEKHKARIQQQLPNESRHSHCIILDIEERYKMMDPKLIQELREVVDPILEEFI